MKLTAFLKDKYLLLLLHLICLALLTAFLHITGYPAANIALISIFWLMILTAWLLCTYLGRRNYYKTAFHMLESMDKPYLLGEMLPDSFFLEDNLHREMLRRSNRSVIEKIRLLEDTQKEYREYLESFVHEIKAPISAITLSCENGKTSVITEICQMSEQYPDSLNYRQVQKQNSDNRGEYQVQEQTSDSPDNLQALNQPSADVLSFDKITYALNQTFRNIRMENRKIENYVDMVLYHARSEQVYKDYLIRETGLQEIIYGALEKERLLLIQSHVQAEVSCSETVYTDKKWCVFIIGQLILNSIKYSKIAPVLLFYTSCGKDHITLTIEDNGKGIPAEDLPRIFEKGFTGRNGREHGKATGMGLYLCKKLCDRLGIGLRAQSEYGKGTKMLLTFPVSSYIMNSANSMKC